jgi:hypothetical protein
MKEEYVEGLIEIPKISEETLPEQLKGLLGQTAGALQQLPSPIRDAVAEGLKLPLGKYTWLYYMITLVSICWFRLLSLLELYTLGTPYTCFQFLRTYCLLR